MTYLPDESQVLYRSKDGKNEKTFDALEWLAAMCSHVPNKACPVPDTGANKWSVTTATTATSLGEGGKSRAKMD
ncbi:MAG: hypothetical protein AB1512_31315 [Thermodesulfobacteriota bacterium]